MMAQLDRATNELATLLQQRIAELEAENARLWERNASLVAQRDAAFAGGRR